MAAWVVFYTAVSDSIHSGFDDSNAISNGACYSWIWKLKRIFSNRTKTMSIGILLLTQTLVISFLEGLIIKKKKIM